MMMMMMMAYSVEGANQMTYPYPQPQPLIADAGLGAYGIEGSNAMAYPQPRITGAGAGVGTYIPYGYRPEDTDKAFWGPAGAIAAIGTTAAVIGGGYGYVGARNEMIEKEYVNKFEKAANDKAYKFSAETPASNGSVSTGSVKEAQQLVMENHLKSYNVTTAGTLTEAEIKAWSKLSPIEVKAKLEGKKIAGLDVKPSGAHLTDLDKFLKEGFYAETFDEIQAANHRDKMRGLLEKQTMEEIIDGNSTTRPAFTEAEIEIAIKDPVKAKAVLEANHKASLDTLDAKINKITGTTPTDILQKDALIAEKAKLEKAQKLEVKAIETPVSKKTKTAAQKRQYIKDLNKNATPTTETKKVAVALTDDQFGKVTDDVLKGYTGTSTGALTENGKLTTAGKEAKVKFGKALIEAEGGWKVGAGNAGKVGGIVLAATAVIAGGVGLVNSNNAQARNNAQLDALMAQERMASA